MIMEVIKEEYNADPLAPQVDDGNGEKRNLFMMEENILEIDVNEIKVEPSEEIYDHVTDIKCEENDVPMMFSKSKPENEMPNNAHRNRKYRVWTEDEMQKAIKAFREGRSQRRAAELYGVPHSCLQRRLRSGQDKPLKNKGGQTTFTKEQEQALVSRLLKFSACGFGMDSITVRRVAFDFAESNKIKHNFSKVKQMAGNDWLIGFRKRNPVVTLRKPEGLSLLHFKGLNRQDATDYFNLLKETLETCDLVNKPHLIYNAHETSCQMNNKPTRKLFAEKGTRTVYLQTCVESGEVVTILACTNATGNFIPPMAIFKGKKFHKEFADGFPNGSLVTMSESGWINDEKFLCWLHHFQTHRVPGTCMLLVDGHASHKSLSALQFCEEHDIHMVCLPSHTAHRLHPLDRPFFKHLKSYYDDECNKFLCNTEEERKISKLSFGRIFKEAWLKSTTPANAEAGFRSTGVYPLNGNAVSEHDYLPGKYLVSRSEASTSEEQSTAMEYGADVPELHSGHTSTSSVTFLLPSPIKRGQQKESTRKQKAVLLTSAQNTEERETLERKRRPANERKESSLLPKVNRRRGARKRLLAESSSSENENKDEGQEEEENNSMCGFCLVKYSDPRSKKLGDWVQCQGNGKEWYHEDCVGAKGKKKFICGKCRLFD
ncbi:uncharacterized protein [Periplaneta americana]|uniref:uncharacterized protein isoform X2 n=1 Tax=Periplaneta americana TaxID=6978 RepID=UPI0037E7648A